MADLVMWLVSWEVPGHYSFTTTTLNYENYKFSVSLFLMLQKYRVFKKF